jgi:aryl-alcohol dehydrogenase-like predicted oxidoreductase
MSLDHYVTLGTSGLRVSPLCLGAMTFGEEWGWGATVEESEAILARFLDRGGNFIDTANGYTLGHSEVIIGDFLARTPKQRDRVVIATKFFTNMFPGDPNGGGASRKSLTAACEESLRRLKTSYIDLYWMHMWDKFTPIEETMRALDDLVRAGKVRYVGFSDTPAWKTAQAQTIAQFRGWTPLVALQIEYSLVERTVEGELMPMARELGLGVTPWGPLRGGALSGKYTRANAGQLHADRGARVTAYLNEPTYRIVDELVRIGREIGATPATVAVAWVQARAGVASTIIGARTREQLEQNLTAADVSLTSGQIAALDAISEPALPFPEPFLRSIANHVMHAGATVNGEPSQLAANWRNVAAAKY